MSLSSIARRIFILIAFFGFATLGIAQQSDTTRVLFVGNSFTYFWNVPQMIQAIAKDQGALIITRQSTAGGATWKQHWEGEKELKTRSIIENGKFDIVVLQNHSSSTIDDIDAFNDYGTKLANLARQNGAEPLLYMTWAYQSNPLMLGQIAKGYKALAAKLECNFVPIGPLYNKARMMRPDLDLFHDDKHQSMEGSYLIALAFYKYLSNRSVLEAPFRLTTIDDKGEKTYLAIINGLNAKFLKELVEVYK